MVTARRVRTPSILPHPEAATATQTSVPTGELETKIRGRAYDIYEQRGRGDGRALEDWLRAESQVLGKKDQWAA